MKFKSRSPNEIRRQTLCILCSWLSKYTEIIIVWHLDGLVFLCDETDFVWVIATEEAQQKVDFDVTHEHQKQQQQQKKIQKHAKKHTPTSTTAHNIIIQNS